MNLRERIEKLLCEHGNVLDPEDAPELARALEKGLVGKGDAALLLHECADRLLRVDLPRHNPMDEILRQRLLLWLDAHATPSLRPTEMIELVRAARALEFGIKHYPGRKPHMCEHERERVLRALVPFSGV